MRRRRSCRQGGAPAAPKKAAVAVVAAAVDGGAAAPAPYQYAYNPVGKRDPFRGQVNEPRAAADTGASLCNEPLCQFDLDQVRLVAVVSGDSNPLAMVEDPSGTGHMVRRSTRMGKQGGKVTQILRDCVVVTEYFTTPDGKTNPNPSKICIATDKSLVQQMDLMNPEKRY